MEKFPFLKDGENVIAILGNEQLQESLRGKQPKTAYSVLTGQNIYFGGHRFYQNYVGDWTDETKPSSIPLNDITSVSYKRTANPMAAVYTFIKLMLFFVFTNVIAFLILFMIRHDFLPYMGGLLSFISCAAPLILQIIANIRV